MRPRVRLIALCLLSLLPAARADGPARKGSLVIVGGGGMPDAVRDRFVELAGGKAARLVIIPTASAAADDPAEAEGFLLPWRKYEPAALARLHTRSRSEADDPAFARALDGATGVWFSGGDQTKLTAAYLDTATHRAIRAVLDRGGVVGGTSAGAAVMSDVMIEGGNPKAQVGRGFGFVANAVVDQHFLKRDRMNRLLGVLADRPGLVGIGIDESTALIVEGDRWGVLGRSFILAARLDRDGRPPRFVTMGDGARGVFDKSGLPVPHQRPARED